MIPLFYDLHLHSCLSPCGDDDMTPSNIVGMSALKGLDVIAITDHNSCKNCAAAISCGGTYGITVIPGMELCTCEEVHVLCLFPTLDNALAFDTYVSNHLPSIPNQVQLFGKQQIYNENDVITGTVDHLLINATDIPFYKVSTVISRFHGIWIPAHIDKKTTSVISNLGFIPSDSTFSCFELHDMTQQYRLKKDNPYLNSCNIICNSDAHYLSDIHEPQYQLHASSNTPQDVLISLTKMNTI